MSRPRSRPRRLFLHTSALSDAEYAVYVDALHDVLDEPEPELGGGGKGGRPSDEELEARMVGMREARAWMRGRFRDVGGSEIDKILQLLAPQQACISGGQFLAALRLLMHARSGASVDEALVFVQAEPSSPTTAHPPLSGASQPSMIGLQAFAFPAAANSEPPTSDLPPPPGHPSSGTHTSSSSSTQHPSSFSTSTRPQPRASSNPFILDPAPAPAPFPPSPSTSADPASFNVRRASLSSAPAAATTAAPPPVPPKPKVFPATKASEPGAQASTAAAAPPVPPGSTNPFLQRAKTHSGAHGPGAGSGLGVGKGKTPPLPPRKPTSTYAPGGAAPPSSASTPAPTLGANLVSPLMKQSLEASKQGHALKRAQAEAERARVLEVIRSSSTAEHRGRASGSRSPTKGHPLQHIATAAQRRPVPSPPRSAVSSVFSATSAGSFDQVASARLGVAGVSSPSPSSRRFASPDRLSSSAASTSASSAASSYRVIDTGGTLQRATSEQLTALDESAPEPSRDNRQSQHQQSPYSAPPTHPDRRLQMAAGHRRSPSYQSTTSAYSSRSQPGSRHSPAEDDALPLGPATSSSSTVGPVRVRTARSQSMHQQSSPTTATMMTSSSSPFGAPATAAAAGQGRVSPPLPPPRRKSRPESMQIGSIGAHAPSRRFGDWGAGGVDSSADADTDAVGGGDTPIGSPFANAFARDWDRDRDRDRDRGTTSSPPLSLSALQRSLSTLHARAQPVLDRARYKAEAGLSRRGFVHVHGRGGGRDDEGVDHLVAHGTGGTDGGGGGGGAGVDLDADTDADTDVDTDGGLGRGAHGAGGGADVDVDVGSLDYADDGADGGGFGGGRGRPARPRNAYGPSGAGRERDSLKLPVDGEGWRPL